MAGNMLLQHCVVILVVLFVNGAFGRRGGGTRESCRRDLSNCIAYGHGFPCQGGGLTIDCRGMAQRCDGKIDCPWGEDELNCGRRKRPKRTSFVTRTIHRTSTTTRTSTSTSTRSSTSTSTVITTSISTSSTSTTTTSTVTFSLAPSSAFATSTITSVLPSFSTVIRVNNGDMISGGFTCMLMAVMAGDMVDAGDSRVMTATSLATITGTATASCSPTTTTLW